MPPMGYATANLGSMRFRNTGIAGAWVFTPTQHADDRGVFLESFTAEALRAATGRDLALAQLNVSVSRRGVLRGIHAALTPPGQAKYVQCLAGRILDVVVDIRPASPTYGQHAAIELDDVTRQAVFIEEGLGHAFCVLSESATVAYVTSTPHDPDAEFGINPLDSDLALPWPTDVELVLSPKDRAAPTLRESVALVGH
jgi:dTDP-4-dehydrorhamnose 3,5-epimerase